MYPSSVENIPLKHTERHLIFIGLLPPSSWGEMVYLSPEYEVNSK